MPRSVPYRRFRFSIEIDGIIKDSSNTGFTDCTFADTSTEAIKYREGNEPPIFRKLSGLTEYGNITLKGGTTDSLELYNWRQDVIKTGAEKAKKSMAIILLDEEGAPKARWNIVNAWPVKYKPADFSSKTNEVAEETLEIAHEGFARAS